MRHTGVLGTDRNQGTVLLAVVVGSHPLKMIVTKGILPNREQRKSECMMGSKAVRRIICTLGQGEELLAQLPCDVELCADIIDPLFGNQGE